MRRWRHYIAIADRVKHVDGYELSADMVALAMQKAKRRGIMNVDFAVHDALNDVLPQGKYDAFMALGLFTCLDDDGTENAIKSIYQAMKPHGVLLVRDGISLCSLTEYFYDSRIGRTAYYRTTQRYVELFEKHGFKLMQNIAQDGWKQGLLLSKHN
jgi:SAM-dependent methyltransferase